MSTPRIDQEAISELKEMLEDEFADLIDTYINDTKTKLVLLAEEVSNEDAGAVRKLAHSLKGASINIGIMALGALCHDLEELAKAEQVSGFQTGLDAINAEFEQLIPELNNYRN